MNRRMDIYKIIKIYQRIKSPKLKLLGLLTLHTLRRRYLYISMDPALACNLRCKLCYFSNPEAEKELHGVFSNEDIQTIARSLFHRGLKLQIGCGAEPTTYKGLANIVKTAKEHGIPHISITTNGNLLSFPLLQELVENGLDELIVSVHGLKAETYERMMTGARFDRFVQLVEDVACIREKNPAFRFRVNYTICADNVDDLSLFPKVFAEVKPNVIQLRPVQDIGSTAYTNYSLKELAETYDRHMTPVLAFCRENGITCLYPDKTNLECINEENEQHEHTNSAVDMLPLFYLSPRKGWREGFDPYRETFEQFSKRTRRGCLMLRSLLTGTQPEAQYNTTKALNYNIG